MHVQVSHVQQWKPQAASGSDFVAGRCDPSCMQHYPSQHGRQSRAAQLFTELRLLWCTATGWPSTSSRLVSSSPTDGCKLCICQPVAQHQRSTCPGRQHEHVQQLL